MISSTPAWPQTPAPEGAGTAVAAPVEPLDFVINLAIAGALAWLLGRVYVRCGTSLSNRSAFATNFVLLAMTTMLIISVVKSSLALSLGLVGALSVVRFRAAIKEPEELAYLFLTIAIGLGMGANQRVITPIAFVVIVGVLLARGRFRADAGNNDFCLTVTSSGPDRAKLEDVVGVLRQSTQALDLKRCDESQEALEACFLAEFENLEALERTKTELRKHDPAIAVALLDNRGIF
ncbi:MAG: DUF4956 domain-containing protein [bacterium]|nr:DUF4956 domain-containing protein [bacterium]